MLYSTCEQHMLVLQKLKQQQMNLCAYKDLSNVFTFMHVAYVLKATCSAFKMNILPVCVLHWRCKPHALPLQLWKIFLYK